MNANKDFVLTMYVQQRNSSFIDGQEINEPIFLYLLKVVQFWEEVNDTNIGLGCSF